jgi:ribonuclease P protein component
MPNITPGIARHITLFTKREIKHLFASAYLISRQPGLDVRIAQSNYTIGRILIVTPRKMGCAPERNRIRRRFKALFYQEKVYTLPYDVILFCKKESIKLSFNQLKAIINSLKTYLTSQIAK